FSRPSSRSNKRTRFLCLLPQEAEVHRTAGERRGCISGALAEFASLPPTRAASGKLEPARSSSRMSFASAGKLSVARPNDIVAIGGAADQDVAPRRADARGHRRSRAWFGGQG